MSSTLKLRKSLAKLERKLAAIQRLIDAGNLGWLTYWRLNSVCRKIEEIDLQLSACQSES
jgi:hypothetical protein